MFKVLPCVLKLKQYIRMKKMHHFRQIFCLIKYSGRHFCSHKMKSILSRAELHADYDGT